MPEHRNWLMTTKDGKRMDWTVYILECGDGTLYTGITNSLHKRIRAHEDGKGAKYTRNRGPFIIRADLNGLIHEEAASMEYYIKQLPKASKSRQEPR